MSAVTVAHTPAPWHRYGATIYWKAPDSSNNWIVAQVVEPPVRPSEECEANAHLIAAAPSMKEAGNTLAAYVYSILNPGSIPESVRAAMAVFEAVS